MSESYISKLRWWEWIIVIAIQALLATLVRFLFEHIHWVKS